MIDAHLHLQDCLPGADSAEILAQLRELGVSSLMVNGTSPDDWKAVSDLARSVGEVIPAFGIHPWKVAGLAGDWEPQLTDLLEEFPEAGVGEVGLDKWIAGYDLPLQREVFLKQLSLAQRFRRPVTIHCLQAWGSLLECVKESSLRVPFLLHSYGGPREMVDQWAELGAYFSISGYFFRPEKVEKLEVFRSVPEDRILLETDAPDMAFGEGQERYRKEGINNHPANIELVYESYAEWSGKSPAEVTERVKTNFFRFRETRPRPPE